MHFLIGRTVSVNPNQTPGKKPYLSQGFVRSGAGQKMAGEDGRKCILACKDFYQDPNSAHCEIIFGNQMMLY